MHESAAHLPLIVQQFGYVCSCFRDTRIYSYADDSSVADFCVPLRSEWKLLNYFFSTCTCQASNIIILSSSPDDGTRIWRHLIEQTIRIRKVKGDIVSLFSVNGITTSYSGEIDSSKQLVGYLRNVSSAGCHHVFLSSPNQPTVNIFKISMLNDTHKIDVSWKKLHVLLLDISEGQKSPDFCCCSLTKLMQPLLESKASATVILAEETQEVDEVALLFREILRKENKMQQELNELKNELFLLENDADAYEDEIRRLHRMLDEHQSFVVC